VKERDHFEDPGVDGRIIYVVRKEEEFEVVD
jgi:hypothetical protein